MIDWFWLQDMMGGHKNTYDSIKALPTLVVHGDDDQIVPGALHGITDTHKDAAQRGPAGVHRGLRGIRKSQQRKC
jgi:non-heme chloroperoxidase